ncbi:MAG: hypothetical protein LBH91_03935 [Prevotellaceae bacterium]|jgi:hypothetical protein|nr:hypothetical protein [Prevotellaceae bacterium]
MNKRRIIIIFSIGILACLGGAFWLLRSHQPDKQTASIATIEAIPYDAIFIVKFKELSLIDRQIADSAAVWEGFITSPAPLSVWLNNTVALLNDETVSVILSSQASISAHPSGKNDVALLCCVALPSTIDAVNWEQFLNRYGQPLGVTTYHDTKIYSLRFDNEMLYFAYAKGIALICSSNTLLQSAIRQRYSGESLMRHNAHFATVVESFGNNIDVGICINHRELNRLLNNIENKPGTNINQFLIQCSNWTVLDGRINPQLIQLSGFSFPSLTNNKFLSILLNQSNSNVEAWEALPVNTTFLLSFTLSDAQHFLDDYADYLEKYKELNNYKKRSNEFDDTLKYSKSIDLFTSLFPAEIALAHLTYGSDNYQVSMLRSNNQKYALEKLQNLSKQRKQTFIESQEKIDERTVTVYRHPASGLLGIIIDTVLFKGNDKYFTLNDNFFYFSDNIDVLKKLAKISTKNSLKKQLQQTKAYDCLSNNAGILLLSRTPQRADNALLGILNKQVQNNFKKAADKYAYNVHALQLRPDNDKFFVNFFMYFSTEVQEPEPAILTGSKETPVTPATHTTPSKPSANKLSEVMRVEVINHYTKEKESFIQYNDNSIALQSKAGKLLWRKKFSAPITGSVIQIDYLNNKKLQCLFVAAGKLYLYDRNGNVVKPFPVTLQSAVKLVSGSTTVVQKQPPTLKISKDGKTTIIYLNNGKVEHK